MPILERLWLIAVHIPSFVILLPDISSSPAVISSPPDTSLHFNRASFQSLKIRLCHHLSLQSFLGIITRLGKICYFFGNCWLTSDFSLQTHLLTLIVNQNITRIKVCKGAAHWQMRVALYCCQLCYNLFLNVANIEEITIRLLLPMMDKMFSAVY